MPDNLNFCPGQAFDERSAIRSAFQLDGLSAAFLHQTQRVADGVVVGRVVAAVGHVHHQKRRFHGSFHGFGVVQHLVHGQRERRFVAQNGHRDGVSDENNVDSSFIDKACGGVVVRGKRGDGFAALLLLAQRPVGGLCKGWGKRGYAGGVAAHSSSSVPLCRKWRMRPESSPIIGFGGEQAQGGRELVGQFEGNKRSFR